MWELLITAYNNEHSYTQCDLLYGEEYVDSLWIENRHLEILAETLKATIKKDEFVEVIDES